LSFDENKHVPGVISSDELKDYGTADSKKNTDKN